MIANGVEATTQPVAYEVKLHYPVAGGLIRPTQRSATAWVNASMLHKGQTHVHILEEGAVKHLVPLQTYSQSQNSILPSVEYLTRIPGPVFGSLLPAFPLSQRR